MELWKWGLFCVLFIATAAYGANIGHQDNEEEMLTAQSSVEMEVKDCNCVDNGYCVEENGYSVCKCIKGWGMVPPKTLLDSRYCKKCNCGGDNNCTFTNPFISTSPRKKCICKPGYEDKSGKCKGTCKPENPCQNGGTCQVKGDDIQCKCSGTYGGDLCEVSNAVCDATFEKCRRTSGFCYLDENTTVQCKCPENSTYQQGVGCKVPCDPTANNCLNGGKCKVSGESKFCSCLSGTSGSFCQDVDECENQTFCGSGKDVGCVFDLDEEAAVCNCSIESLKFDRTSLKCRSNCDSSNCKNGGICEGAGDGRFCRCKAGTSGSYCEVVDACGEEGYCGTGDAKCYFDVVSETAACNCSNSATAYDSKAKECKAIDECLVLFLSGDGCNNPHEICESGKCMCEDKYKRSDDNKTCEEDKCSHCPGSATCDEKGECKCGNGYFDGDKCVAPDLCLSRPRRCQHLCEKSAGNCSCVAGFNLTSDGFSCEKDDDPTCTLECGPGSCLKTGDDMECVCPETTHVFVNKTCIDICTASNGDLQMCQSSKCETDDEHVFRCKCGRFYEQADDGIHCRKKKMCKEKAAIDECGKKSSECKEHNAGKKGYRCECRVGFKEENGVCTGICELKDNRMKCGKKFAVCELDVDYNPYCKCPPLLMQSGVDGPCNKIAENSYLGTITLKNMYEVRTDSTRRKRSTGVSIDNRQLAKDVMESARYVYGPEFQDAKILSCEQDDDLLACEVELQVKAESTDANVITSPEFCYPLLGDFDGFCLVNLKLILKREKDIFHKTDPCEPGVREKLCEEATNCTSKNGSNFECRCLKGFYTIGSYNPVASNDDTFIQKCNDIDECRKDPSKCPRYSTCLNTYGDFECICQDGYRRKNKNLSAKEGGCIGICDPNPCLNDGKCVKVSSHGYACQCKPLFTGILCNETVAAQAIKTDHRSAAIVGGVFGTLLVIIVIIVVVLYRKLNKTKGEDDEYSRHKQRGVMSEISRLRGRPQSDNPDKDLELRSHERLGRQRGDSGEFRREWSDDRIIPRVQTSRSRTNDQDRIDRFSESENSGKSGRHSRQEDGQRGNTQYKNRAYEED